MYAQEKNEIIQQRIEFIAEQMQAEEVDLTNILEVLMFYQEHPLNLNNASIEELQELSLLSELQIRELLLHRSVFGKLITIYELQSIPSWDLETIRLLGPFVTVLDRLENVHVSWREALKQGNYQIYLRSQFNPEKKQGYIQSMDTSKAGYIGDPFQLYTRLRYTYRTNISIGITGEKDAGEKWSANEQTKGFDFYSAHAFFKGGKYLRGFVLGDYQLQIGQGVAFWSGFGFGKTADPTFIKKTAVPIKPYTSVDENRFMRGAAIDLGWKSFGLTVFSSRKKMDATIGQDTLGNMGTFSSVAMAGLHRTESELAKRDQLTESIIGANLRINRGACRIGGTYVFQGYDKEWIPSTQPYSLYAFSGKNLINYGLDYSYSFKNALFFGELAQNSITKGSGQLHGVLLSLDARTSLSILYRNYSKNYQGLYRVAFGESAAVENESGCFSGLKLKIANGWFLTAYTDIFSSKWLKYQVDAPSQGKEYLTQLTYKPTKQLEVYLRYRYQNKEKNRSDDQILTSLEDQIQQNIRLHLVYQVSDGIQVKSRVELVQLNSESIQKQQGWLLSQDVLVKPKSSPIDLSLRYVLFDTDSYSTRIYAYENNALFVYSVPAYYYTGSRCYALIRYSFWKRCSLWMRYGTTVYVNRSSIGSGLEEIKGDRKSDITLQFRIEL